MNREETRVMIREEIRSLLKSIRESTDWYTSGYGDLTTSAAHLVLNVVDRTVMDMEPEPPDDPFAPKRTAQDWADDIAALLQRVQNDGHEVWLDADQHVHPDTNFRVRVGSDDTAPVAWESER